MPEVGVEGHTDVAEEKAAPSSDSQAVVVDFEQVIRDEFFKFGQCILKVRPRVDAEGRFDDLQLRGRVHSEKMLLTSGLSGVELRGGAFEIVARGSSLENNG